MQEEERARDLPAAMVPGGGVAPEVARELAARRGDLISEVLNGPRLDLALLYGVLRREARVLFAQELEEARELARKTMEVNRELSAKSKEDDAEIELERVEQICGGC